ncbi:MAG: sporulation protein YqfD [Clostridia bacterium]|nr:sporulation protein YqfD [Clostridia bacterium]
MIVKLVSYLKGYVKIHAKGFFLERFLNLCKTEDIILLNLSYINPYEISAKVSVAAFRSLRNAARKTRTKIKIQSKHGLPFFISRNKNRRGFAFGIIVFLLLIWYLSGHLMGISIEGNNRISEDTLISSLNSYGVEIGTPLHKINTKFLKNQLMTANDDLGWLGLSLKGSRLYITLTERKQKEVIPPTDEPCNLVAKRDGVIRLMEIRDGQTMVLNNTLVKEGDLLVSGVIDSKAVGMRYTHSFGEVYATTWYKEETEIPLKYKTKTFTGKKKSKLKLNFLNLSVPLYIKDTPPFSHYEVKKSKKVHSLPLEIFPALTTEKMEFFEQKEQTKERTVSEAVILGKFQLMQKVNSQLSKGAKIEKVDLSFRENGDSVTVILECECLEDIAVKTPIDKSEELEYNEDSEPN